MALLISVDILEPPCHSLQNQLIPLTVLRNNILIIFKCFISRENKYFRCTEEDSCSLMADSLTATIMAARMNSPFPVSLLVSLLSLPPHSVSFYLSFHPLFFPLVLNRSLFLFLSAAPHVPTHVHAREIHSPSSGRCSLSSLPLSMPSIPGLSLRFQQWRLHKSRYNAEMDQWEWPRPTQRKRDTACVCIVVYTAVHTWSVRTRVCSRVGSVNMQQTRQTIGHQEWIRIKFVTSATTDPVYAGYINNLRSE